ncbi:acetyl-CoA carboxylase biotin carboxyl carrier protein subunit [Frankia sp. AgB32]|uniref:acetyl-CoA carboxylase biotin carboxyl carrier protein n=1 Tax=Frankia sp. AgB32 TaxID=631119 RepID=UPI0020105E77|nr:acetyl-CoA carboxylase biotin carboxyl carrier protein subunit [Frankia sp. AgB32]MCK9897120.1 acetyl-CoA carboxylase biotin carboxyl carrier protein subunit [Frankia sp. AgB32]
MTTDQATRTATNGAHPVAAATDPVNPLTPDLGSPPALAGTLPAVDAIVGVLSAHLLELAVRAPVAPSVVRLSAGDVTVEMGWSDAAPSLGDAAPARTRWTTAPGVARAARSAVESDSAPALTAGQGGASANGAAASDTVAVNGSVNGAGSVADAGAVNGAGSVNGAASGITAEAGTFTVGSPSVGVFYRASEPGKPPFVTEGDVVRAGQQVGIVEAMKLMIPIEAERAGRVVRILAEDTAPIEHDQPLFLLAPVDGDS